MIIRVPVDQIPAYWSFIKEAALLTEEVNAENTAAYLMNLICDLYCEKVICFVCIYNQNIQRLYLATSYMDNACNRKILLLTTLYSFDSLSDHAYEEMAQILKYAQKNKYAYIEALTSNKGLINLAEILNIKVHKTIYRQIV